MVHISNVFGAPYGSIVSYHPYRDSEQVALLLDSGVCEWVYIEGKRYLIIL